MVTPEIQEFVKQQHAAGKSTDEIRASLISSNWSKADIDQLLGNSHGITIPKWLLVCLSIILIFGILGGGAYAYFQVHNRLTSSATVSSAMQKTDNRNGFSSTIPSVAPTSVTPTPAYTVYQDSQLRFSYDSSWKKISSDALIHGRFDDETITMKPENDSKIVFFFSPTNWQVVKKVVQDLQVGRPKETAVPVLTFMHEINKNIDFELTMYPGSTNMVMMDGGKPDAHSLAQNATQGICNGDDMVFSTDTAVVESRIQEITISNKKAYVVLPESTCNYKSVDIYVDNQSGDHFMLQFYALDLQHLSPGQHMIFKSLQVN